MTPPRAIDHAQAQAWLRAALALPQGQSPFPWQEALLTRFLAGEPVRALDIPTGLGKTATMAIWLVARACRAPVPRRLVYIVDRRAVVDQATDTAEALRGWVQSEPGVAEALALAGQPLPISTLRGQHVDNREWLADPSVPAIVLGTVDMIGSRVLFSGYGVSRKMRPYHAGLLGADTLMVLDEAHLTPALERLLDQVATGRDANGRPLGPATDGVVPPLRFMSLSATGRARAGDEVLTLSDADNRHPVVSARMRAPKAIALREAVADKELPSQLADEAWSLSEAGARPCRIIVFCTSRDDAQKVQTELLSRAGKQLTIEVELFVGGRRIYEREAAATWLRERGFIAGTEAAPTHASFVIATAAGEVGVDLDADHAVCDLVAWERMVQRLGRVNRRGKAAASVVVVPTSRDAKAEDAVKRYLKWSAWATTRTAVEAPEEPDESEDDDNDTTEAEAEDVGSKAPKLKVEERSLAERTLRHEAAGALIGRLDGTSGARDGGPASLLALRTQASADPALATLLATATTPAPLHPPLVRALVEAWSMTSLEHHTGRPEVEPWLRGWPEDSEPPQTSLVWRSFLPLDEAGRLFGPADLAAFREAAAPHLAEQLDVETWRVVDWAAKRAKALRTSATKHARADATAAEEHETETARLPSHGAIAVVLDSGSGRDRVLTLAELVQLDDRRALERTLAGATLLIDARVGGLLAGLLDADTDEPALDVSSHGDDETRPVPFRVRHVTAAADLAPTPGWRVELTTAVRRSEEGETAWLLVESLIARAAGSEDGRAGAKNAQLLDEHQAWTEAAAARIAHGLGLCSAHKEVLTVAARLHDEGKRAAHWQRAFGAPNGGKPPYAKTVGRPRIALLEGYRHELGSLPRAEAHPRVQALAPELRELCLHLIAAHHGGARPLLRTDGAEEPPSRLAQRARDIALRFTELEKVWGPWGLAWWESLMRAADQQASRRNDEEAGRHA